MKAFKDNIIKYALWGIAGSYLIFILVTGVTNIVPVGIGSNVNIGFLFVFAIVHGLSRYRFRDLLVFFGIVFAISNLFENLSIMTCFPFGNYHYTDIRGIKLFLVPVTIAPAYFAAGYLSWSLAHILLDLWSNRLQRRNFILVPVVASFIMVAWDLCMDPVRSTVQKQWIWHEGGGYFGVPLTNYAGWYLCVYIYNQLFALYLSKTATKNEVMQPSLPKAYWYQAVLMYFTLGLSMPLLAIFGNNVLVIDQSGKTWATGDIYQSMTLITIFTMWFIALLCALKISRKPAT
ncbi:MAG: carotenoid biosynthesis protein [Candidatus Brocadiales bacterium]|nr:carotenoid biosynthesis protein [Candidatus Brocadiales bacterium]